MTRHSTRRKNTIPGLKICRTCGQIYTRRALVCPNCHRLHDLTRTISSQHVAPISPVAPTATTTLAPANPRKKLDANSYPQWLRNFDAATQEPLDKLSYIAKYTTGIARETARALLAYRYREDLGSTGIDLPAVEKEVSQWFVSHQLTA